MIGVGGCVAQQEGAGLLRRFTAPGLRIRPPEPGSPGRAGGGRPGARAARARRLRRRSPGPASSCRSGTRSSPRPRRAAPSLTVMEGCDLFCAFCVVPRTRGREVSRPSARDPRRGACAGRARRSRGHPAWSDRQRLRPVSARDGRRARSRSPSWCAGWPRLPGIERVRFTSPHPIFVSDDLARCYAELPELCPHLHLPVQSGFERRAREAMNRRHTREEYLEIGSSGCAPPGPTWRSRPT